MLTSRERELIRTLKRPFFDLIRLEGDTIVDGIAESLSYLRGTLLDLGCGAQPYADLVKGRITSYIGTDLRPNASVPPTVCSDSLNLPFKPGSFDSILCTQVLEHVRDPFMTMSEIGRVLRPDGYVVMTMPALWPLHEEPYDYFRYTKYGLSELARISGLSVVSIRERGGGIMAISQLAGTLLYDKFGANQATRWMAKLLYAPLLSLGKRLDSIFYYPRLTLGYVMVAYKP